MTKKILLSCFEKGLNNDLPLSLGWASVLIKLFPKKYKITVLIHGECIKYSLVNSKYYGLIKKLHKKGIHFRVCGYCLKKDGYHEKDVAGIVKIIKFSIDYMAKKQSKDTLIVYD